MVEPLHLTLPIAFPFVVRHTHRDERRQLGLQPLNSWSDIGPVMGNLPGLIVWMKRHALLGVGPVNTHKQERRIHGLSLPGRPGLHIRGG